MQMHQARAHNARCPSGSSRRAAVQVVAYTRNARRLKYMDGETKRSSPALVTCKNGESDMWRLQSVVSILKEEGGVGIIPTDTLPALVADLENRDACLKLYRIKELDPKKPLSILCRNFSDIAHYTTGFPAAGSVPGQRNLFNVVKRLLPGPYTLILGANKNLPSQMVDLLKGKTIHRKSVGVRIPDDPFCRAVLEGVGGPLLCTSVHVPEILAPDTEVPDAGQMLELYGGRGIDFIVDVGKRIASQSTVVDLTGPEPQVVRVGLGDPTPFTQ